MLLVQRHVKDATTSLLIIQWPARLQPVKLSIYIKLTVPSAKRKNSYC